MDDYLACLKLSLLALLQGDLSCLDAVTSADDELLSALGSSEELVVTRTAVCSVLEGMRGGELDLADVQRWASFVKRGYVRIGSQAPPLDLAYEEDWDSPISDVVSRLDQIGDTLDGIIDDEEMSAMIGHLCPREGPNKPGVRCTYR